MGVLDVWSLPHPAPDPQVAFAARFRRRFERWKAPQFVLPFSARTRIAVLGSETVGRGRIRQFATGDEKRIQRFGPEVIAGCHEDLLRFSNVQRLGGLSAVVVLWYLPDGPLHTLQRLRLWHLYRVPVFEHFYDSQRRLAAYECEAHQFPHAVEDTSGGVALLTGMERGLCACGEVVNRWVGAQAAP